MALIFGACLGTAVATAQEPSETPQAQVQPQADVNPEVQVGPQALVKIDDFTLTSLHFALFASQTGRAPQEPAEQIGLLNELVNSFMVANSPQGQALAKEPEVAAALDVARARLIAQAFVRTELDKAPVDEAQLRARYDAEYGKVPQKEYKARHILLKNEEEAQSVIAQLDGGADFATLAAEHSIGPSKTTGGDLGWFAADDMVGEFSTATAALIDGSYTKTPVKTKFGWHVILREQSRDAPPPSFDSVKEDLTREIQQEQVAKIVNAIREKTHIEVQRIDAAD
ncbi:MAG: peptidylprolyl isomerase [Chromatiaceae bacterium]|nr:peptidylprolyl isomerase [Chromatiaceae bacterium]